MNLGQDSAFRKHALVIGSSYLGGYIAVNDFANAKDMLMKIDVPNFANQGGICCDTI